MSWRTASKVKWLSSLPGVTYAVPNCLVEATVSLFASATNCAQVQFGPGTGRWALANSVLL